jgi:hypothetical protein
LTARKSLNDLSSGEFTRRRELIDQRISALLGSLKSEGWPSPELAYSLHICDAELRMLEREYDEAFERAKIALRASMQQVPPLVEAQIATGRLDIARWLTRQDGSPAAPTRQYSQLPKVFRRKRREHWRLLETLREEGLKPDAETFVMKLASFDSPNPPQLGPLAVTNLLAEVMTLLGGRFASSNAIERTPAGWLVSLDDPVLARVAPHLWSDGSGLRVRLLDATRDSERDEEEFSGLTLTVSRERLGASAPDRLSRDDLLAMLDVESADRAGILCSRLMSRIRNLEAWWPTRLENLQEYDAEKQRKLERLLGCEWSAAAREAANGGLRKLLHRVAERLAIPLDAPNDAPDALPVSVASIVEFFAGGDLLSAVDLLVYALPKRRLDAKRSHGGQREAPRIEEILRLSPDKPLGKMLLRRVATADGADVSVDLIEALALISEGVAGSISRAELEGKFDALLDVRPDPGWCGLALQAGLLRVGDEGADVLTWRQPDGIMSLFKLRAIAPAPDARGDARTYQFLIASRAGNSDKRRSSVRAESRKDRAGGESS